MFAYLVGDQEHVVLVGDMAQLLPELGAEVVVAALALDRLEQDAAHVVPVRLQVVHDLGDGLLLVLDGLRQVLARQRELDLFVSTQRTQRM